MGSITTKEAREIDDRADADYLSPAFVLSILIPVCEERDSLKKELNALLRTLPMK